MNAKDAKQIPLEDILHRYGYEPAQEIRGELWYLSPFRDEKEASFKINLTKNLWFDFGEGKGGNVLDFIMKFSNSADVSLALKHLEAMMRLPSRSIRSQRRPLLSEGGDAAAKGGEPPHIEKIQPLQNSSLIRYLHKRGISKNTAAPYVMEIHYTLKGKTYFALAFPNASGGYEVRNPDFKGGIGTKDISWLVKRKNTGLLEGVTVFEGFIDFLSALTFYRVTEAKTPVIVLNSVSLKDRALKKIKEMGFEKVYLYLDRDEQGERGVQYFSAALPRGIAPVDKSDLYAGYKDFNEFLVQNGATPSDPMRGYTSPLHLFLFTSTSFVKISTLP